LLSDRAIEDAVDGREILKQEWQGNDPEFWVDRIDDATQTNIDRTGTHAFGDRSFITKLTIRINRDADRAVGVFLNLVPELFHCLLDQAVLA
jgi:hypothetical protein